MKITKRQLRRIIREAIATDPTEEIGQALKASIFEIAGFSHCAPELRPSQDASSSPKLTYTFMSTWGAHDNKLWNRSTTKAREIVLGNLVNQGAVIEGGVPPMNDFGTPGVKFSLGGRLYELVTTGYRYDVEIYAKELGQ